MFVLPHCLFFDSSLFHKSFYWFHCNFLLHSCVMSLISFQRGVWFYWSYCFHGANLTRTSKRETAGSSLWRFFFPSYFLCRNRASPSTLHCVWASCKFTSTQPPALSLGDGTPIVPGSLRNHFLKRIPIMEFGYRTLSMLPVVVWWLYLAFCMLLLHSSSCNC